MGPAGLRCTTSAPPACVGMRNAQPRVCEASLESVRQSCCTSSLGWRGVPLRRRYSGVATHRRRLSATRTLTSDESGRSPTRTAQSKPSAARSTTRSLRLSESVTAGCSARNRGTSGATWRRPKPAGAVTRKWPLARTPPADTLASALATSASRRWQSSRKAAPSCVRLMRRVVRTRSLTPRCSSSASSRRPMMAGATPSARAAAVRLPRVATDTKDSKALSLSMGGIIGTKCAPTLRSPHAADGQSFQAKSASIACLSSASSYDLYSILLYKS